MGSYIDIQFFLWSGGMRWGVGVGWGVAGVGGGGVAGERIHLT